MDTLEQQARDLLDRLGVDDAQSWSAGDIVELANLMGCQQEITHLKGQVKLFHDAGEEWKRRARWLYDESEGLYPDGLDWFPDA